MLAQVQEVEPRVERDRRFEALDNILTSQSFAKSPRLCAFLSYVVEKSIAGELEALTEQQLGIHVFNRSPGYNSNDDNIVRGTARILRQRLSSYYLIEGKADSIRIEIPKGAYVAQFFDHADTPVRKSFDDKEPLSLPPEPTPGKPAQYSRFVMLTGWVVALVFAGFIVWPLAQKHRLRTHAPGAALWRTLFASDRRTLIVPGDAGLNMYEFLQQQVVDLDSYSKQEYNVEREKGTIAGSVGSRFYTSTADLHLVMQLSNMPQASDSRHIEVRFARDVHSSELNDANLILIGTQSYNPWVELFHSNLTLRMQWNPIDDVFVVKNLAPKPGEQKDYFWTLKSGTNGGLTLISLTDNTLGGGHVLLIEGTTMIGVSAGAEFLQNRQLLDPIIAQALRPDGTLRNFDVLLQSDFVREGATNLHILATHIH